MLMLNRFPHEYLFEENHMDDRPLREHEYYMHVAENMNNFNCPTHCLTAFITTNIMFDKMRYKTIKMVRFFPNICESWLFFCFFSTTSCASFDVSVQRLSGFRMCQCSIKWFPETIFNVQFLFAWPYTQRKTRTTNTLEYFFHFFFRITTWLRL